MENQLLSPVRGVNCQKNSIISSHSQGKIKGKDAENHPLGKKFLGLLDKKTFW
ncbi:MAG: hypothetical protein Q4C76_05925 [Bacillota bacterium]|nr:hypothetical protein [Bacillota bacterium]